MKRVVVRAPHTDRYPLDLVEQADLDAIIEIIEEGGIGDAEGISGERWYLRNDSYSATVAGWDFPLGATDTKSDLTPSAGSQGQSNGGGAHNLLSLTRGTQSAGNLCQGRTFTPTTPPGAGIAAKWYLPLTGPTLISGTFSYLLAIQPQASQPTQELEFGWYVFIYRPTTGEVVHELVSDSGEPAFGRLMGPPIPPGGNNYAHILLQEGISISRGVGQTGDVVVCEFWVRCLTSNPQGTAYNGNKLFTVDNDDIFAEVPVASYVQFTATDVSGGGGRVPHRNYTMQEGDELIAVDATNSNIQVTLLSAQSNDGYLLTIKKIDSSNNTVTIVPDGTETIDGASSKVLGTQYESITLYSDGNVWWVVM